MFCNDAENTAWVDQMHQGMDALRVVNVVILELVIVW